MKSVIEFSPVPNFQVGTIAQTTSLLMFSIPLAEFKYHTKILRCALSGI